ncbi:MAG: glycosyltransferase [Isosphaeraceae bacterium]
MEPVGTHRTHVLVLNYNGRDLLAECLPSVVEASRRATSPCTVSVVDNDSTDGSAEWLARTWPGVGLIRQPNRGLASFNEVLRRLDESVVLLLNNDIKLDPGSIDPLVAAVHDNHDALFAAPLCWDFDGQTYEGMRTRVRTRFGMVQGMCRVPGHEEAARQPDLTAAAGPVLAVHRLRFLALGGYDPVFFPGRIEDLDLGFRGWMAGWKGLYVPDSVAYHRGFASFGPAFGASGCDYLAARNTILFAWKNLSGRRLLSHLSWLPVRLVHALIRGRLGFARALIDATRRLGPVLEARREMGVGLGSWPFRQEEFFHRFNW